MNKIENSTNHLQKAYEICHDIYFLEIIFSDVDNGTKNTYNVEGTKWKRKNMELVTLYLFGVINKCRMERSKIH